jgi:hypothetical protein
MHLFLQELHIPWPGRIATTVIVNYLKKKNVISTRAKVVVIYAR